MTTSFRNAIRSLLLRRMRVMSDDALGEPTLVIAPHQDDETLGCGGTIARKRQLGARVRILYTTDGCRSHEGLIGPVELARIRADEAVAACEVLGVPRRDVSFLGIENGALEKPEPRQRALAMLKDSLAADAPRQVFIPYHREPPPDHFVTTELTLEAIEQLDLNVSVYEYPIWFWHFWPFSWDDACTLRERARKYRTMLRRIGPALRDLRVGVPVDRVLDKKRRALARHASQTERRGDESHWPILDDVCGGAFTEIFFQPYELFYERHRAPISEREACAAPCVPAAEVAT